MHIYGIKNCNSVKKALNWMEENGIDYTFHDFKKEGISDEKLREWEKQVGWEALLNKRGTTWRKVAPEIQAGIVDGTAARKLMMEQTSVIKRPVIESPGGVIVGFDGSEYATKLKS